MSETSIEPQSIAAAEEPQADPDLNTYRVLRQDLNDNGLWHEMPWITTKYVPLAAEIGEAYGEGNYLLIETDGRYSFMSTYEMHVVADRVYRLADEDA